MYSTRGEVTCPLEQPCWNRVALGSRVSVAWNEKVVAFCMFIRLESEDYFVYCIFVPGYAKPFDMWDGTCS